MACSDEQALLRRMSFSGRLLWPKGIAREKSAQPIHRRAHQPGFQPWSPNIVRSWQWGTHAHGTIRPRRKQEIDAVFLAAYLIVFATAATATLLHPKPELIQAPRLDVSPCPVAALGEVKNPKAPAVKREAEEDWGR
jgi:hypothetical protein